MKSLGEILLDRKQITEEGLAQALSAQKETGERLDQAIVQLGLVGEGELLAGLAEQLGVEYVRRLEGRQIDPSVLGRVPREFALRNRLLPVQSRNGVVVVATSDPLNLSAINEVTALLNADVELILSDTGEVTRAIHRSYPLSDETAEEMIEDLTAEEAERGTALPEESRDLLDMASQAPIIRLVNMILFRAVEARASDVHIQPTEQGVKVRCRVDGMLHDVLTPPKHAEMAIVSRIKIMSHLNVAERRLPQDGRATIRVAGRAIDIRISVIPTAFGERVVMRLLDKETLFFGLEELGMETATYGLVERLIRNPHGIIFVTGPTGSGKTTTLYAALSRINSPEKNIITIEDPIEYQLEGVSQIQVKPKIGLSFANGLRSIVRQDPDVIMVGEVRDRETAEIAIHASLTGHLVFSTLHTNDAPGAITRLLDMGIEPYLVSSTVIGVLAQRLLRLVHEDCREPCEPAAAELSELGLEKRHLEGKHLYRGRGCAACLNTGYRGRMGIYELLVVDDDIRAMVLKQSASGLIRKEAVSRGMVTLRQDGLNKVLRGLTTVEEVLRVTQD